MSDSQTPWQPPPPRLPGGCGALILVLIGAVMLVPGLCAVLFISENPKVLLPNANGAGVVWWFLAIGIGGVALIAWVVSRAGRKRQP